MNCATSTWIRRRALVVAVGCLATLATACGGDDDESTPSDPPTAPPSVTAGGTVTLPPPTSAAATTTPTTRPSAPPTTPATAPPTTTAPVATVPPATAAPTTPGPTIEQIGTAMLVLEYLGEGFTQTPYDAVTPLGVNLCGERAGTVRIAETRTFSGANDAGQTINLLQSLASFATVADAEAAFESWRGGYEDCPTGPVQLAEPSTYTVKRVEVTATGLPLCVDVMITGREFTTDGQTFASSFETGALVRCGRNVMLLVNVADEATASADGAVFQLFSTLLVTNLTAVPGSADV